MSFYINTEINTEYKVTYMDRGEMRLRGAWDMKIFIIFIVCFDWKRCDKKIQCNARGTRSHPLTIFFINVRSHFS